MNDSGRLCHSLVVRLKPGGNRRHVDAAVARLRSASDNKLWVEEVRAGPDSAAAAHWRDRELARPVDGEVGPALRSVLLKYDDDVADLVLVAHRAKVSALDPIARAMLGACGSAPISPTSESHHLLERLRCMDPPDAPEWGLGDTRAGTAVGRLTFDLPVPHGARPDAPEVTLLAGLGLAIARYSGVERVLVGDSLATVVLEPTSTGTVGGYLRSVEAARATDVGEPASVGLMTSRRGGDLVAGGVTAEWLEYRPCLAPVHPLSMHVREEGGALRGSCSFLRRFFDEAIVEQFTRHLAAIYRHLLEVDPQTPLAAVEMMDDAEQRRIVKLGSAEHSSSTAPDCIHRLVGARAAAAPEAVAVRFEGEQLSYRELDDRATRVAWALRANGVEARTRVGVCLERSLDLVVILLGVMKVGAAYVPMDPAYPDDRLRYTSEDAELAFVVFDRPSFPAPAGVRVLRPDLLVEVDTPLGPLPDDTTPDDPAYVIYTSGSTGWPKGVVIPHRNVVALLAATTDDFGLGPADTWTFFHSAAFDFSVWEIWGCLMTGGRLVVVPYWVSRSPEDFAGLLTTEGVTVLSQTPSAFGQLMELDRTRPLPRPPRLVVFGGEPLDTRPLLAWFDRHPESECRLVNMFGITETTVHVTAQTLTRREALAGSRSVGRALPGWSVYVMDSHQRLLPPGVVGEIYVGGEGVADHYLNRPELTSQRFVADPFSPGRLYRSGDRGRLLPDGRLEHHGRLDDQVKVRGHRIELNEVRSRLLDAPGVGAAAVVLREAVPGDGASITLDGYVVFHGDESDVGGVRRHAAQFLPEYMVPATITPLVALPLTPNGKVDVARLPEPLIGPTRVGPADDEGGSVEETVRVVFEEVFGMPVGLDDNFFSVGGNSLLAVRTAAALRARGLPSIALRDLYLNPTVSRLAALFADAGVQEKKSA